MGMGVGVWVGGGWGWGWVGGWGMRMGVGGWVGDAGGWVGGMGVPTHIPTCLKHTLQIMHPAYITVIEQKPLIEYTLFFLHPIYNVPCL